MLPLTLAATYLAINLGLTVWIAREEVEGRVPAPWVRATSRAAKYGPPLLGLFYLVTIAGDWPFVLFVGAFFAAAFWALDGFLSPTSRPPKR